MKRILLILILLFSGCEASPETIPVLIYDMRDAYMYDFSIKIRDAFGDSYIIRTVDGQNSQIIQNEQIDNLIDEDFPLLIINPVDRLSVYAIIEKAKESDTTIIFFNREPLASDLALYDKVYYVGADAVQSAQLQASLIMDLFGNDPENLNQFDRNQDGIIQTIMLKGEQGHQDAEARSKYVIESLTDANFKVELLDTSIANWDKEIAKTKTEELIQQYGNSFDLLISNNDAMAIGAIEVLKEHGYFEDLDKNGIIDRETEPWLPVVGIDGLEQAIDLIVTGYLYGTVKNDSQNMALIIIELTQWLKDGKDLKDFPYEITDGKYVWVNYQKLSLTE